MVCPGVLPKIAINLSEAELLFSSNIGGITSIKLLFVPRS